MRIATESCPVTVSEHPFQGEEGPLNGGGNYDPLKVTKTRCLSKIRLYAGTPEYLTLLSIESDNVMSAGNQQERLDTWCDIETYYREILRDCTPDTRKGEDTVRPPWRHGEVTGNRGPPPSDRRSRK